MATENRELSDLDSQLKSDVELLADHDEPVETHEHKEHEEEEDLEKTPAFLSCLENGYTKAEILKAIKVFKQKHGSKRYNGEDLVRIIEGIPDETPGYDAEFSTDNQFMDDKKDQSTDGVDEYQSNDEDKSPSGLFEQMLNYSNPSELTATGPIVSLTGDDSLTVAKEFDAVTDNQTITTPEPAIEDHVGTASALSIDEETLEDGTDIQDHAIPQVDEDEFLTPVCGCHDAEDILVQSWAHLDTCPICATQMAMLPIFLFHFYNTARNERM